MVSEIHAYFKIITNICHCTTVVLRVCMNVSVKLKLAVKLGCVDVLLDVSSSVLFDPLLPPTEQQRCCCSCQMLTAAN